MLSVQTPIFIFLVKTSGLPQPACEDGGTARRALRLADMNTQTFKYEQYHLEHKQYSIYANDVFPTGFAFLQFFVESGDPDTSVYT